MNVFDIGFFLAMENSSDSYRGRKWLRAIHLVLGLLFLVWLGSGQLFAQTAERLPCDSCRFQVNSLDQPFKLSGNWLFTRDDSPRNNDIDLDTSAWTVVKAPGPWKKAYDDGKKFTVGWYRANFEFASGLVGQEVVLLADAYMSRVAVFVDGQEVFRRPGNINIERYYSVQPIPLRFTITHPRHVVAIRVETPLMHGIYQLPFDLRKYTPADSSLSWYQFWGGELRLLVGVVAFFFGLFFLLVHRKTRYRLYFVAAMAGITSLPFFAAPNDALLKVVAPETLLYIHYMGLWCCFWGYYFSQFMYKFTPRINRVSGGIFFLIGLGLGTMAIAPNLALFLQLRVAFLMLALLFGFGAAYQCARGAWNKKPGARVLLFGVTTFLASGINDNLLALGKIDSLAMLFAGMLVFMGSILYVASSIFANVFRENKRLGPVCSR